MTNQYNIPHHIYDEIMDNSESDEEAERRVADYLDYMHDRMVDCRLGDEY